MTAATPGGPAGGGPGSLRADPVFVRFWCARAASLSGTVVTTVLLPVLVFELTGSAAWTALLTALEAAPYLLFGLVAGTFADRVDRRRLMVGCDLANAALLASIPLADAVGGVTLAHVAGVALVSGCLFVWFDAANFGALPALVGRDRLVAATSAVWSAEQVLSVAGPAAAGVLTAWIGPADALWWDAGSYLASAMLLLTIRRPFQTGAPTVVDGGSAWARMARDAAEGLRFVRRHPLVRVTTLVGFGATFTGGAVLGLLVVYGVQALGLPRGDSRIGVLYAVVGIGSLLATVGLPVLAARTRAGLITVLGLVGTLIGVAGLVAAPTFAVGIVFLLVWDAAHVLVVLNGITIRQMVTPDRLQGRVNAAGRMLAWSGQPLGAVVGGLVAQAVNVRMALAVAAVGVATVLVVGVRSPLLTSPLRTVDRGSRTDSGQDGGRGVVEADAFLAAGPDGADQVAPS